MRLTLSLLAAVLLAAPARLTAAPTAVRFEPAAELRVEAHRFFEVVLRVDRPDAANPFTDVSVEGDFGRDGDPRLRVDGFCDAADGSVFRIRFMPTRAGRHDYTVRYRQGDFTREFTGRFEAVDAHRRGLVRVDPHHPWHFVWDGTAEHYFWNGTTAYWLLGCDDDSMRRAVDRLAGLKVNRLRVALSGRTTDGRRWGEPKAVPSDTFKFRLEPWPAARPDDVKNPGYDVTRFNLAHWQRCERLLQQTRDLGVVVSIIFHLDGRDAGVDPFGKANAGGPDEQRYYRYAVARLAAYSNVMWDVTNEYRLFRTDAWAEQMGAFLKQCDPYDHLTSVHGHGDFRFMKSPWADFAMYQSWDEHGGYDFMLRNRQKQAATGRPMPQVNEEYGYEDHYPTGWGEGRKAPARSADNRRRLAWEMTMAGGYQTTGERADTGAGGWITGRGDAAMTMLEGYGHLVTFMTAVPWWQAEPRPDRAKGARCLAADDFLIAYLPRGGTATVALEAGTYHVRRFNPRNGEWSAAGSAVGPTWTSPALPDGEDWAFLFTPLPQGAGAAPTKPGALPRLKVSDNQRFLVTEDGRPFFYLGDTAWELFHRLNREEADRYLKDRAAKRFTVIQAVVLAELDGLKDPNPYGHVPLKDNDPTRPNEDYFKHVDWIVDKANERGLYIAMLPTWGDKVGPAGRSNYAGPELFTSANAAAYGEWLGKRYKDRGIIWVLGGDRDVDTWQRADVWRSMARGLKKGDSGRNLMTFHPRGGQTSSTHFHDDDWLDFNMWQTGHDVDRPVWDSIGKDYARAPTKPTFDGEPLYEDHPIGFNARERGYSNAADIRRSAYRSVFAGGHGYTYGNHSVWQIYAPNRRPINGPIKTWMEALDAPGAGQVRHLRALMESRPFLTRVPDQSILASDQSAGSKRVQATRDQQGRYAFIHTAAGRPVTVRLEKLTGPTIKAWWFDTRSGASLAIGEFPRQGEKTFTPPSPGESIDWVLVLDDVSAGFPPPGQPLRQ